MHHLTHSMTKQCKGRAQNNAGLEGVPVYGSPVYLYIFG